MTFLTCIVDHTGKTSSKWSPVDIDAEFGIHAPLTFLTNMQINTHLSEICFANFSLELTDNKRVKRTKLKAVIWWQSVIKHQVSTLITLFCKNCWKLKPSIPFTHLKAETSRSNGCRTILLKYPYMKNEFNSKSP